MSLEDLKRLGVYVENREAHPAGGNLSSIGFITTALLAIAGCVAIAIGDGGVFTWLGLGLFCAALAGFILVNIRAVQRDD